MSSSGGSISSYIGGKAAAVVAVVAVVTAAFVVPAVTGGGGGGTTANLWVDTNGGTCTRQGTAGTYTDAAACGTWDAAYDAASAGDVVRVKAGRYDDQTMAGAKGSGAQIEFRAEGDGDDVTVDRLSVGGGAGVSADRLSFYDFTVIDPDYSCPRPCASGTAKIVNFTNADSITLDNVDVDRTYDIGDGVGVNGGVDGLTWSNFDICCNAEQKLVVVERTFPTSDPVASRPANTSITFEHGRVHDQVYTLNNYGAEEPPHAECWIMVAVTTFVMEDVENINCISTGVMNWGGVGLSTGVHIFNSVIDCKYGFSGGSDVVPGAIVGYRASSCVGPAIDGSNIDGTGTVEYNYFGAEALLYTGWDALTMRGNIGVAAGCIGGGTITYLYNIWTAQDCSASDVTNSNILNTGNFVDKAGKNFRPASGSVPQVNGGDPGSCPAEDADGNPRPVGGRCDAGPYEWQG